LQAPVYRNYWNHNETVLLDSTIIKNLIEFEINEKIFSVNPSFSDHRRIMTVENNPTIKNEDIENLYFDDTRILVGSDE